MRSRRLSGLILVTAALALFGAAPVSASGSVGVHTSAVTHKPDGWIRYYRYHSTFGNYVDPSPWVGNNIYNTTGTNQTNKQPAAGAYEPGDFFEWQVTVQNDGAADRFKFRATGAGSTFTYRHGTTNITNAVVAGTFKTPSLASAGTYTITVRALIATGQRLITIKSVADPTKVDAVLAKVKYSSCGC